MLRQYRFGDLETPIWPEWKTKDHNNNKNAGNVKYFCCDCWNRQSSSEISGIP